ncbi:hypothetical protein [Flavobacterium litorale]|uniref:YD repeat-containing protein n=1 Tax=Flavobacterium litorale TaxID=2856519 RepID=A0ABX8V3M2_9FLAO|nr:hypothetical protein [Flavobacterium litorale]QYJ67443.1 hypothetical protein K1I41_07700 [Flavobacterium litorale]
MKIRLLLSLIMLFFISCSSDDTTTPTDENNTVEKHIKEIAKYSTNLDGEIIYVGLKKYENGVPIEHYSGYNSDGSFNIQVLYTYDNESRLMEMEMIYSDRTTDFTFEYDTLGRLISKNRITQSSNGVSQTIDHSDFDYSNSNQIIESYTHSHTDSGPGQYYSGQSIMYLDDEGYVYKTGSSENSEFIEATYQNGNIISISKFQYDESTASYIESILRSYVYDTETEVRGEYNYSNITSNSVFLGLETNLFGSNKANAALFNGGVSDRMINYPIQFLRSDGIYWGHPSHTKVYEFDSDGYPIKVQSIIPGGEIYVEHRITYYE